jgi:hypothetical protein
MTSILGLTQVEGIKNMENEKMKLEDLVFYTEPDDPVRHEPNAFYWPPNASALTYLPLVAHFLHLANEGKLKDTLNGVIQ